MTNFLTPVGQLVIGDCFEPQKYISYLGVESTRHYMALAFPKAGTDLNVVVDAVNSAAQSFFRSNGTLYQGGGLSYVFAPTDGDRYPYRKGFAGCWVLSFSSVKNAPERYIHEGADAVANPAVIKLGSFVRIYFSANCGGSWRVPGVQLNPLKVEFIGYGEEIAPMLSGVAKARQVFNK